MTIESTTIESTGTAPAAVTPAAQAVDTPTESAAPAAAADTPAVAASESAAPSLSADDITGLIGQVPKHLQRADLPGTMAEMVKAYKGLRTAVPETADGYELTLDEPVSAAFNPAADENTPLFGLAKEAALEQGLSPSQFNSFLNKFLGGVVAAGIISPIDQAAELEKLGGAEKGQALQAGVSAWALGLQQTGVLDEADLGEVRMLTTTAEGVRLLDKLRAMAGEKPVALRAAGAAGSLSRADLDALLHDPRYTSDPAFRADVDAKWAAVVR